MLHTSTTEYVFEHPKLYHYYLDFADACRKHFAWEEIVASDLKSFGEKVQIAFEGVLQSKITIS